MLPANSIADEAVGLSWDPSSDSSVVGYNVYYGSYSGDYTNMVSVNDTNEVEISGLVEGVTYFFAVAAYNPAGVESELSNEVSFTIPGIDPPSAATSFQPDASGQGLIITWNPSLTATVVGYNVFYGTQSGNYAEELYVNGTNETDIPYLQTDVTYYFAIQSVDATGMVSSNSAEATYTLSDVSPPGPIVSFEQVLPDNFIQLTWTPSPSTDVMGYNIYYGPEEGDYYYTLSAGDTNEAEIYGLLDGTTYYFAVTAVDNSGQESALSGAASYTVPPLDAPAAITSIQPFDQGATVFWTPSTNPAVIGYVVYSGPASGYYTQVQYVYSTNAAAIYNLEDDQTIFFAVASFDDTWQFSDLSPEASYFLPAMDASGPTLQIQLVAGNGNQNVFSITSPDSMPSSWSIESSTDLQTWQILTSGVDPTLNVTVVVSAKPGLFFRLNNWYFNFPLQVSTDPTNPFANSFSITSPDVIPGSWTIESSDDLQNWTTLSGGADSHVNVAVVYVEEPVLFFRLNGQ